MSAGPLEALPRTILREQVRDVLLGRILAGEYAPGSRLVETRIAQELGISQAPVREALRDLEQLGCVVHEPFRGCSVRSMSLDELLEAFPVRAALEALAARLAAERITDDELARLEQLIAAMGEASARGDRSADSQADAAFHETIVAAAGNGTLARQWAQLQPHARTFISLSIPEGGLAPTPERHLPILDALRARDGERAAAVVHAHLMEAAAVLRAPAEPPTDKEQP